MAVASLIDTLKLVIALLDALATLEAEVDETVRATVCVRVEPAAASWALRFRANAFVSRHDR